MSLKLRAVKVDFPQVARAVPFRLVVEVGRLRISAFAARGYGHGAHAVAELDYGDKAVAAGAVPFSCPRIDAGLEQARNRRVLWRRHAPLSSFRMLPSTSGSTESLRDRPARTEVAISRTPCACGPAGPENHVCFGQPHMPRLTVQSAEANAKCSFRPAHNPTHLP